MDPVAPQQELLLTSSFKSFFWVLLLSSGFGRPAGAGVRDLMNLIVAGFFCFVFLFVCLFGFCLFSATPEAYGSSQARRLIEVAAACLHHSYSNSRSELCLQPTPQLMAMPDP